ncbi:MAG: hypothetical protein LBP35_02985 [Candidatus Ancillula trichonymphae]|jgi:hypothetical protein|nr:hypothetical protein [Candidatus Ancillula trichonymphae]
MDVLTVKCAKDNGFDSSLPAKSTVKLAYDTPRADPIWGVFDPECAKKYGYLSESIANMLEAGIMEFKGNALVYSEEWNKKQQAMQSGGISGGITTPHDSTGKSFRRW